MHKYPYFPVGSRWILPETAMQYGIVQTGIIEITRRLSRFTYAYKIISGLSGDQAPFKFESGTLFADRLKPLDKWYQFKVQDKDDGSVVVIEGRTLGEAYDCSCIDCSQYTLIDQCAVEESNVESEKAQPIGDGDLKRLMSGYEDSGVEPQSVSGLRWYNATELPPLNEEGLGDSEVVLATFDGETIAKLAIYDYEIEQWFALADGEYRIMDEPLMWAKAIVERLN